MNTTKLAVIDRFGRGVIGAAALAAVLMVPGLSEGLLFTLAMVGFYTSLTALLNADLVQAMFKPVSVSPQTVHEDHREIEHTEDAPIYKKAA